MTLRIRRYMVLSMKLVAALSVAAWVVLLVAAADYAYMDWTQDCASWAAISGAFPPDMRGPACPPSLLVTILFGVIMATLYLPIAPIFLFWLIRRRGSAGSAERSAP